jgi:predicted ATP-dependent serine protease
MNCLNCNEINSNPKFCSRSCAASYNNKIFPKRKANYLCKTCLTKIRKGCSYCKECRKQNSIKYKTLGELKKGNANQYGYPMIRQDSRKTYIKSGKEMSCKVCKYSYHVDVCHIKDIKSFEDKTLILEINKLENLIALCKNHHYEFDKGDLKI